MEQDTLLIKIKKLWKKANSAKTLGSVIEAQAFFDKVNQMLIEHNLTHIDFEKIKDDRSFIIESENIKYKEKFGIDWRFYFIGSISSLFFCDTIFNTGFTEYSIIGSKDNIEIVKELINYLIPLVSALAEQKYLERILFLREKYHVRGSSFEEAQIWFKAIYHINIYKDQIMPENYKHNMRNQEQKYYIKDISYFFKLNKQKFINDFTAGFASGLNIKIREERKAREQIVQNNITNLVVLHKEMIEKFVIEKYPKLKYYSQKVNYNGNSFAQGIIAGKNLDLNKKVETSKLGLLN
jgi:hypothetical protein